MALTDLIRTSEGAKLRQIGPARMTGLPVAGRVETLNVCVCMCVFEARHKGKQE